VSCFFGSSIDIRFQEERPPIIQERRAGGSRDCTFTQESCSAVDQIYQHGFFRRRLGGFDARRRQRKRGHKQHDARTDDAEKDSIHDRLIHVGASSSVPH